MNISGTYEGLSQHSELVLRLDVDGERPLNMVSGELTQPLEFAQYNVFETLEYSFVGHNLTRHDDDAGATVFSASLHFFRLPELTGDIEIEVRSSSVVARLHLTGYGFHRQPFTYSLAKTSRYFRSVRLEIDVEDGIDPPVRWRPFDDGPQQVPAGFPPEPITIPTAFERSGIEMIVGDERSVVPNTAAGADAVWSSAELHAAMVSYFSLISDDPGWNAWFMVADRFEVSGVSGIMFDSDISPPRQGAAVFWNNFAGLPDGVRERNFIRTSVHEIGHALNLLHSFQKGAFAELAGIGANPFMVPRSDALSFMNYPWRYPYGHNRPDGWNGTPDYWSRFRFEFDNIELMHLRHHDQLDVGFGGQDFGAFGHARDPKAQPAEIAAANERSPVELELRGKKVGGEEIRVFELMEPVQLELKVSCKPAAGSASIAERPTPGMGPVEVYIQRPSGEVRRFKPIVTLCRDQADEQTVTPEVGLYESINLTYGKDGFSFADPGAYAIRLVYLGDDGMTAYSNALSIRVAAPRDAAVEAAAADFFEPEKGQLLAVGPCASSYYDEHLDDLQRIGKSIDGSAGRALRAYVATSEGLPFKDVKHEMADGRVSKVTTNRIKASPKTSAQEIEKILKPAKDPSESLSNLAGYELAMARVKMLSTVDDKAAEAAMADVESHVTRSVSDNKKLRQQLIDDLPGELNQSGEA